MQTGSVHFFQIWACATKHRDFFRNWMFISKYIYERVNVRTWERELHPQHVSAALRCQKVLNCFYWQESQKKKVTKAFSESNRSCNDTTGKRMAYILGGISKTEKYCVTRTSLLHLQSLVSTLFAYFLLLHRYRGLKYINHMNHLFFSSILVIPNTSDVDRSRLFFFFF